MNLPPIDPAIFRSTFNDESAVTPAQKEGKIMRLIPMALIAALVASTATVAFAAAKALAPNAIQALVAPCKETAERAYRLKDLSIMDRYVEDLLREPVRKRDTIIACGAYLMGVEDGADPSKYIVFGEDPD